MWRQSSCGSQLPALQLKAAHDGRIAMAAPHKLLNDLWDVQRLFFLAARKDALAQESKIAQSLENTIDYACTSTSAKPTRRSTTKSQNEFSSNMTNQKAKTITMKHLL